MPGVRLGALPISLENRLIHSGRFVLQPRKEGRTEVKADFRVVVEDLGDAVVRIQNSRCRVGRIAFSGDPLIPVVVGVG